eukprot:CAMPEP_0174372452 /NCGR_PEP_ID=MMETSP0811_2-20130205/103653_1 /TAXON_ID=73025 ORGANISM="Eutreptiella gymnastica-like, Strain CCMP1594" /NCGR_SAMPLE_ID=MMETSP0811_2 /ASSEMBLY_ACC=CAM_ASM_000667 /LENGTH=742 /DNA_ID=CAMNT_0015519887 /DNA_START=107 /DNA_END=2331 /DNA_ORIENTATION=+
MPVRFQQLANKPSCVIIALVLVVICLSWMIPMPKPKSETNKRVLRFHPKRILKRLRSRLLGSKKVQDAHVENLRWTEKGHPVWQDAIPPRLKDSECSARVVLFMVLAPLHTDTHGQQVRAMESWKQLGPQDLTLVSLVTDDSAASLAVAQNVPHFRVPTTAEGWPHSNAIFHILQTSCQRAVVALTHGLVSLGDARAFNGTISTVLKHDWQKQPVVSAAPYRAFQRSGNRTEGWLAVAARANAPAEGTPGHEWHDFWMWNTYPSAPPLTDATLPPFWFGMPELGTWLLASAVETASRHVLDLNGHLRLVHPGPQQQPVLGPRAGTPASYSTFVNRRMLYAAYPRRSNSVLCRHPAHFGRVQEAPWKLAARNCDPAAALCVQARTVRLNFEPSSGTPPKHQEKFHCRTQAIVDGKCSSAEAAAKADAQRTWTTLAELPTSDTETRTAEQWPYSMAVQLQRQATRQRHVLLTIGNAGFIPYLWNFVCNLYKLNVSHFVIAALDNPTFEWGVSRGLPIFLWRVAGGEILSATEYGTRKYEHLTKTKPQISAKILELGYSVFFVDPDVVLFRNPLDLVDPEHPDIMLIQTDAEAPGQPNRTPEQVDCKSMSTDANQKVNSGFYWAPAIPPVIDAFKRIAHLVTTPEGVAKDGDQPIFNEVLCEGPHGRRVAHDKCFVKFDSGEVEMRFFPQFTVANGKTAVGTRKDETMYDHLHDGLKPRVPGMVAIHNNYIVGKENKIRRQVRAG